MRTLVCSRRVDGCVFARDPRRNALQLARDRSRINRQGIPLRFLARAARQAASDEGRGELGSARHHRFRPAGTGFASAYCDRCAGDCESYLCQRSLLPSSSVFRSPFIALPASKLSPRLQPILSCAAHAVNESRSSRGFR